jgi:hypothetical protein
MLCRIGYLALQGLEPASHDIRFAEAKLSGQLLQATPLLPVEIYLYRFAHALYFWIMRATH